MNETILLSTVVLIYGSVLLAYELFGKSGLYCVSALAGVLANIEVVILIRAFGMEQTLGNVLFGATFLVTDILSECEGKRAADKAVALGLFSSLFFLAVSQSWLLFEPSDNGTAAAIATVFTQTPRVIAASLAVYVVSQFFDVWLYHKWWDFTQKRFSDKRRFLWLRNNGSTLVSQLINAFLFNICAFAGMYDLPTLMSICGSSYVIFVFTSLLDTPFVYLARRHSEKRSLLNKPLSVGANRGD